MPRAADALILALIALAGCHPLARDVDVDLFRHECHVYVNREPPAELAPCPMSPACGAYLALPPQDRAVIDAVLGTPVCTLD